MRIGFCWQGVSDPKIFAHWNDGLREAMRIIEHEHDVMYYEPWDDITNVDVILYWEAPCTINGKNSVYYNKVRHNPLKKILLFAGGPLNPKWVEGFDLLAVESKINAKECEEMGIPYITAFGINDEIFKYKKTEKIYDGIHHGTCAAWKRQGLVAQALKEKALLVGRHQSEDPGQFDEAIRQGAIVMDEQPYEKVCELINQSHTLVQTSDFWGGGQRATLEAMACGVPPIVMEDSPKNREFVEAAKFGAVVPPNVEAIREFVEIFKKGKHDPQAGVTYVQLNWTSQHYANSLLAGINQVLK